MKVIFEKNCGLVKDNNLKSQLTQKGFGFRKGLETYLDLFECFYFLEKKKIIIVDKNSKNITTKELKKICNKEISDFSEKYIVFKEFTEKGYVAKDGNIFGFDFRVYKKSKAGEHTHTEMVVDVFKNTKIATREIIKSERLATTINAKFVMAIVDKEEKIQLIKIEKI
jgi:tRNA-intron endonuclease, archaea type